MRLHDTNSLRRYFWLAALVSCCLFGASGCKLLHPPVVSALIYPILQPSSNSIDVDDYDRIVDENEATLQELRIGVLSNAHRAKWNSKVGKRNLDRRQDENVLLHKFLEQADLFGEVVLVDDLTREDVDYYISCSADCIYDISLDSWMYAYNWILLGAGFVLGMPYQDSSATYVVEAVFFEGPAVDVEAQIVGASMVMNYKEWFGDNIYWRPSFYGESAMYPLFSQILYDFLLESGCLL